MRNPRIRALIGAIEKRYPDTRVVVQPWGGREDPDIRWWLWVLDVPEEGLVEVEGFARRRARRLYGRPLVPLFVSAVSRERRGRRESAAPRGPRQAGAARRGVALRARHAAPPCRRGARPRRGLDQPCRPDRGRLGVVRARRGRGRLAPSRLLRRRRGERALARLLGSRRRPQRFEPYVEATLALDGALLGGVLAGRPAQTDEDPEDEDRSHLRFVLKYVGGGLPPNFGTDHAVTFGVVVGF